jgi:hypothetical protein
VIVSTTRLKKSGGVFHEELHNDYVRSPDGTYLEVKEVNGMPHTHVDFYGFDNPFGKWGAGDDDDDDVNDGDCDDDELECKVIEDVQTQCNKVFYGPLDGIPIPEPLPPTQSHYGPARRTDIKA